MDNDYVAAYRDLYERHWWWRSREKAVLSVIRRHHRPAPGGRVLDIGCGDGLFFDKLSEFGDVEGIEIDERAVSENGLYRSRIHVGPFDDSFTTPYHYQLVTMLDVLEHIEDATSVTRRIHSLLTDDGLLVLTVPAFRSLWTGHDTMNHHVTRYTVATLRDVIEPAGLEIISNHYLFHWVGLAKLLVKWKERVFGENVSPPRVPPRPINWLLTRWTSLELRGGRGLGIPFGSSLLAVARRAEKVASPVTSKERH